MTFYRDVPDDMMSANDVELADALLEAATARRHVRDDIAMLIIAADD